MRSTNNARVLLKVYIDSLVYCKFIFPEKWDTQTKNYNMLNDCCSIIHVEMKVWFTIAGILKELIETKSMLKVLESKCMAEFTIKYRKKEHLLNEYLILWRCITQTSYYFYDND